MNARARTTFAVVACLLFAAHTARAQDTGSISGKVVDQTGRGIEGVQIALGAGDRRALTDADGTFQIMSVARGIYQLSARRIGYGPNTATVTVRDSSATNVTITLTAIPRVLDSVRIIEKASGLRFTAVVLDQNDQPVAGAHVMAVGAIDSLLTDSAGHFSVGKLPRGTMMLRMRKMGYQAFFDSYRVDANRVDTLRMRRLTESLSAVEINERSGFGKDYWMYRDLSQRTRWKASSAGAVSREELAPQGKLNLCDALRRTPSGNHYVFIPPYICPRATYTMLIDGALCQRHMLTDFTADAVEAVEYFPGKSDWSGNLSVRCPGAVFVIWLRHDEKPSP